ncbi:MAG: hypothetical protein AB1806_11665 [Acidobacteriota bacterium]
MHHSSLRVVVVVAFLLALGWTWPTGQVPTARPAPRIDSAPQGADDEIGDEVATPAEREAARTLVRLFVTELEAYVTRPELRADQGLKMAAAVLSKADPQVRNWLSRAASQFAVRPDADKQRFLGAMYAPTIQQRLALTPAALARIRATPLTIKKPMLVPRKFGLHPALLVVAEAACCSHARLILRELRCVSKNDDNDEDEIYFGLTNIGYYGRTAFRKPDNANEYWVMRQGQSRRPNTGLVSFQAPPQDYKVVTVVSVFEEDEGTWDEIFPVLVDAAEYALEGYLASEIGTILASVVMSFLDDLFDWIEDIFTNEDDYLGSFALRAIIHDGKAGWKSTGTRVSRTWDAWVKGEDADYTMKFYWELRNGE